MLTTMVLTVLLAQVPATTETQAIRVKVNPAPMPSEWLNHLNAATAEMPTPGDARAVLTDVTHGGKDVPQTDPYYIIHVLRWSDLDDEGKQTVDKQNWYVFRWTDRWTIEEFSNNKRLYGSRKLGLLSIQLNCVYCSHAVEYRIDVKKKNPANVVNLFDAIQLGAAGQETARETAPKPANVFAFIPSVDLWYGTSDISVVGKLWSDTGEEPGALNKKAEVFDNEGLHRWDVSFAVPIRSVKQLQFDAAGQTVSPAKPNRDSLLAVFDIYPAPTDIKRPGFSLVPYIVAGVGVSAHPQDRILIGGGFGPAFAQFYAGVIFEKIQPAEGTTSSGSWWKNRDKQFAFGINLPVRAVKDALKKQADEKKKDEGKKP